MTDMFKNAYFGKAYQTRDGKKVIFSHTVYSDEDNELFAYLMSEHQGISSFSESELNCLRVSMDGTWHSKKYESNNDVVSEWQEPIKDIFQRACFGSAYKTRNGRKALFISSYDDYFTLYVENSGTSVYTKDGLHKRFDELDDVETPKSYSELDIVSEWMNEIDEKKLDYIANECYPQMSQVANVNVASQKETFKR